VYRVVSFRTRKVLQDKRRFGKTNMFLCKTRELLIGNKMFARFEEDQLHPITGPPLTLKKNSKVFMKTTN
jgi:hypothetical protein